MLNVKILLVISALVVSATGFTKTLKYSKSKSHSCAIDSYGKKKAAGAYVYNTHCKSQGKLNSAKPLLAKRLLQKQMKKLCKSAKGKVVKVGKFRTRKPYKGRAVKKLKYSLAGKCKI